LSRMLLILYSKFCAATDITTLSVIHFWSAEWMTATKKIRTKWIQ
jgi:hypothetical protein